MFLPCVFKEFSIQEYDKLDGNGDLASTEDLKLPNNNEIKMGDQSNLYISQKGIYSWFMKNQIWRIIISFN